MRATSTSWIDDDALWAGLNDHVRATLGIIGIEKALAARSEDDARAAWVASVRAILDRLAPLVPLAPAGPARFSAGDGVALQFDIHQVVLIVGGVPRMRTLRLTDPASLALALVGEQRWGERWLRRLRAFPSDRPLVARVHGTDVDAFPWVAQNPGGPAPWPAAATREDAGILAIVEDLGFERMAALFQNVGEETDE